MSLTKIRSVTFLFAVLGFTKVLATYANVKSDAAAPQFSFHPPRLTVGRFGTNVVFLNVFPTSDSKKGNCFEYHGIFKCGNDAVRNAIALGATVVPVLRYDHPHIFEIEGLRSMCKTRFKFATIREPLEHFISGYTEYIFRMLPNDVIVGKKKIVDIFDRSLTWLSDDSAFHRTPNYTIKRDNFDALHLLQMSRAVDLREIDFLVRVEYMDKDLHEAMKRAQIHSQIFNSIHVRASAGAHGTEEFVESPQQSRSQLKELLLKDHSRRLQLCNLLALDYECLGYDPERCRNYSENNTRWNKDNIYWPHQIFLEMSVWRQRRCRTKPLYFGRRVDLKKLRSSMDGELNTD